MQGSGCRSSGSHCTQSSHIGIGGVAFGDTAKLCSAILDNRPLVAFGVNTVFWHIGTGNYYGLQRLRFGCAFRHSDRPRRPGSILCQWSRLCIGWPHGSVGNGRTCWRSPTATPSTDHRRRSWFALLLRRRRRRGRPAPRPGLPRQRYRPAEGLPSLAHSWRRQNRQRPCRPRGTLDCPRPVGELCVTDGILPILMDLERATTVGWQHQRTNSSANTTPQSKLLFLAPTTAMQFPCLFYSAHCCIQATKTLLLLSMMRTA